MTSIRAWLRDVFSHEYEPCRMVCAKCGLTRLEIYWHRHRRCLPGGLPK